MGVPPETRVRRWANYGGGAERASISGSERPGREAHQDHEPGATLVVDAVSQACRDRHELARGGGQRLAVDDELSLALDDVIELVLVLVGVDAIALAGLQAVQSQEESRALEEGGLEHL